MDYKNKYEQALERAKAWCNCEHATTDDKILLKRIFPELAESEDERIRKTLINGFNKLDKSAVWYNGITNGQILDWLEKQAQKPQGKSALEAIKEEKVDNQNCVKHADKVESKFKIGDLITNGILVGEIDEIHELGYHAYFGDHYADVPDAENWHKWTIQDAKDGDFLVCGKDKLPFIFKGFLDKFHPDCPVAYCGICEDGIFSVSSGDGWWTDEEVFPANKEQREQLEKAIFDAGYMWDAEKRELKKTKFCCKGVGKKEETGALKKMLDLENEMITPEESLGIDSETYSKIVDECIYGDEQKPTDEEMKRLLQTEYEKGMADAITKMQKSNWNEEDEVKINRIVCVLENLNITDNDILHKDVDWLKSIKYRVQPKQEWSEEDIDNIKNIIILCTHSIEGIECTWIPSQAAKIKKLMESILHSSKLQSQWKPSDEQMKLLREVQQALLGKDCHNRFVNFMYELKRLREE